MLAADIVPVASISISAPEGHASQVDNLTKMWGGPLMVVGSRKQAEGFEIVYSRPAIEFRHPKKLIAAAAAASLALGLGLGFALGRRR